MNKPIINPVSKLKGKNASEGDVDQAWELDNQAWWDWYVTLAETEKKLVNNIDDSDNINNGRILSIDELRKELSTPYSLNSEQKNLFFKNGFLKIKNLFSENAIFTLNNELSKIIFRQFSSVKMKELKFLSLEMIWIKNQLIKEFVLSSRIAKTASALLGGKGIRLYHDNVLVKRPGCGRTPWHYDIHHFPLATKDVITVWIPAQPIPEIMGPLSFAMPIETYKLVENIEFSKFNDSYDKEISKVFREKKIKIESSSFEIGEISFHHNLSFHSAGSNNTIRNRTVLANTYFADGSKVIEKPTMVSGDWQKFIPDTLPGEIAASPLNPICWPKEGL